MVEEEDSETCFICIGELSGTKPEGYSTNANYLLELRKYNNGRKRKMNENQSRVDFSDLLKNEAIANRMKEAQSLEDIQKLLVEQGVNASLDQTKALVELMYRLTDDKKELSEESLESVSGGSLAVAVTIIGGVWTWAKEMENKNSATYKATYRIVTFWGKKFGIL